MTVKIHRTSSWEQAQQHKDFKDAVVYFFDELDHKLIDHVEKDPVDFLNLSKPAVGLTATAPDQLGEESTFLALAFKNFEFFSLLREDV